VLFISMSNRCSAMTKEGKQCTRMCPDEKCFQHTGPTCSVCMECILPRDSRQIPCGHTFHTRCLDRWKRTARTCPVCRAPFDQPLYRINVIIEPVNENTRITRTWTTPIIQQILDNFGIDAQEDGITHITFEIEEGESLDDVLEELSLFEPPRP
jgi:Ring finger domain